MKSSIFIISSLIATAVAGRQPFGQSRRSHARRQDLELVSSGTMSLPTDLASAPTVSSSAVPAAESLNEDPSFVEESGAPEENASLVVETAVPDSSTLLTSSSSSFAPTATATDTATKTEDLATATESFDKAVETKPVESSIESRIRVDQPIPTGEREKKPNLDLTVLNLAFVLEQLESKFYETALKKWKHSDYVSAGFSSRQATIIIEQLTIILSDESTHSSTLASVITSLGSKPFSTCSFNFDSVLQDPLTFISVARSLESVGVSAYLGAAHLLSDPALLTAAGSILTLESRHQSLLNIFNGGSFAGQAFDIALTPQQVLALAGGFLQGCSAADLGLTANEPLGIVEKRSQSTRYTVGSHLSLSSTIKVEQSGQFCHMIVGGRPVSHVAPAESCIVPEGIDGPVMVYLSGSESPMQSNILQQNAGAILAGPGLIFVDSKRQELSTLFVTRNGKSSHMGCANFGYMEMNRRSDHRKNNIIVVVKQVIIINNDDRNDRNRHDDDRNRKEYNDNDRNDRNRHDEDRNRKDNDRNQYDNQHQQKNDYNQHQQQNNYNQHQQKNEYDQHRQKNQNQHSGGGSKAPHEKNYSGY